MSNIYSDLENMMNFENADDAEFFNNFDNFESYGEELKKAGLNVDKATQKNLFLQKFRANRTGLQGTSGKLAQVKSPYSAQFDVVVNRKQANYDNINFALFSPLEFANSYKTFLNTPPLLTSMITRGNPLLTLFPDPDKLYFYNVDTLTLLVYDIIEISCKTVPYIILLYNLLGKSKFLIKKLRITTDTDANADQFQQGIQIVDRSLFGKYTTDTLSQTSFITPFQYAKNIVDLNVGVEFDNTKLLLIGCKKAVFSFTMSFFVDVYTL